MSIYSEVTANLLQVLALAGCATALVILASTISIADECPAGKFAAAGGEHQPVTTAPKNVNDFVLDAIALGRGSVGVVPWHNNEVAHWWRSNSKNPATLVSAGLRRGQDAAHVM